ncbi:hypothetical protein KVT40_005928 [Elsinoe batatas]|uniref:Uncharacterized protein n=1 Tax=Elsinoe batatas TaxID=2601811 RepID=A0A8K0PH19_9PEZI|nr:hypothetical protein KVT40_005928 [Elsinoe batatas]
MAPEAPKRRFAPTPVETTTKSNRSNQDESSRAKAAAPRKFAVEPVETSVTRNTPGKNTPNGANSSGSEPTTKPKPRKFAIKPVETSSRHNIHVRIDSPKEEEAPEPKKPRKFAVQPVETSTKISHKDAAPDTSKPRKFAVQPVEETVKSSKGKPSEEKKDKPKSRFTPQPVETTERRRRSHGPARRDSELDETPADIPVPRPVKKTSRKFHVDLIDTSKRSRKNSDELSPVPQKFRTDVVPGHMVTANGVPLFPAASEIKRLPLPHERRKERHGSCVNIRSHSFLAPDLETIESSESEASDTGSPLRSKTPSAVNDSPLTLSEGSTESYKQGIKAQEVQEEKFSQFMSGLEAQRAEQKLREQVLAAFPNSDFHEPVEHYVNNDDNDSDDIEFEDRPATWEGHEDDEEELMGPKAWRQATSRIDWELEDMKKHHEELEKARAAALLASTKRTEASPSPWWNAAAARDFAKGVDPETTAMRDGARPPMLGTDLVFPRSKSPEPARFDITQGSETLRTQMCYLTEQAEARAREPKTINGLWGGAPSPIKSSSETKGLWAGLCASSRQNSSDSSDGALPSGLVTPAILERANPFDETLSHKTSSKTLRPPTPTPPHTRTKMQRQGIVEPRIDSVLNTDEELDSLMEADYPDTFVTQVFNYLSLGYPSLARPFDDELAKISGVPVSELRKDDAVAKRMPKGYIRIGDDFEGRNDGTSQDLEHNQCARWRALKKYIREWARQEKGMVQVQAVPWGTGARRGSWAW